MVKSGRKNSNLSSSKGSRIKKDPVKSEAKRVASREKYHATAPEDRPSKAKCPEGNKFSVSSKHESRRLPPEEQQGVLATGASMTRSCLNVSRAGGRTDRKAGYAKQQADEKQYYLEHLEEFEAQAVPNPDYDPEAWAAWEAKHSL